MKRLSLLICCVFSLPCALTIPFSSQAGTSAFDLSITNEGYAPQVTRIPVGTSVTWTNLEGVHTTTSRDGLWDSGVLTVGETFTYSFDSLGLFPYYDTIHNWPSGTIQVVHSLADIEIYADASFYRSGETMDIGIRISNPREAVVVSASVWVKTPGGGTRIIESIPSITLRAGLSYDNAVWRTITLPPLPRGTYSLHASLVKEPEGDLISTDRKTLTFGQAFQSDWSEGPGETGPSRPWGLGFDTSTGVAWRSLEGQISLSSPPRAVPVSSVIATEAGKPNSVATGDLNGDGRDDVVTTDPTYAFPEKLGAVYWWERQENGTWVQDTVSADFYGATHVNTADVDSDGDLDVIATAYYGDGPELGRNGKFAWFENLNGDASAWEKYVIGDDFWGASYIDSGDLDGDGDIDLVGASQLTDGIYEQESDMTWFENLDGAGHYWGQHDLDLQFTNASEAHVTDLDGDGDLDIVGAYAHESSTSQFAWWENENGDASIWTKHWIPFDFWGSGYLNVGDIDGDGDIDLIGGGYNAGEIGFWENRDGTGTRWIAWYVGPTTTGRGVELCDLDGDGDLDAIAWNSYWMSWLENTTGSGYYWNARYMGFDYSLPWAAAGDVDNDGKLDIVVTSEENDWPPPGEDQLIYFDISQFGTTGELESAILDGDTGPGWGVMNWDAATPPGTSLAVEVRASNDEFDLGPYYPVPSSGTELSDIIDPDARYLQYRVNLSSGDPAASPVLRDLGVEIGEGIDSVWSSQKARKTNRE